MVDWGITASGTDTWNAPTGVYIGGAGPADAGMTLDSMHIYFVQHSSGQARMALYSHNSLANTDGMTLIEDVGQTSGTGTGWNTISASSSGITSSLTGLWVAFKHPTSQPRSRFTTNSASAGNFQTARGGDYSGPDGSDPTVAFSNTSPTHIEDFRSRWHSVYISYTAGGASGWSHKFLGIANASIGKINGISKSNIDNVINVISVIIDLVDKKVHRRRKVWGSGLKMWTHSYYEFWARSKLQNLKIHLIEKLPKLDLRVNISKYVRRNKHGISTR